MKRFIVRRIGYALLSLVVLSATIFVFVRLTGDPAVLLVEPGASKADIDAIRTDLGLDRPLIVQYALFVKGLLRADFGRSFYYRTPVLDLYFERLPNSLLLALVAMAFSLAIGIPSGILAAVRVNGWWDGAGKLFALLGLSMPSFWVGLLLILFFSVYLGWLPSSGSGTVWHVLIPAFGLGCRRQHRAFARHRSHRPRRPLALDLRRARVDGGGFHGRHRRRRAGHRARHPFRLSRRLG